MKTFKNIIIGTFFLFIVFTLNAQTKVRKFSLDSREPTPEEIIDRNNFYVAKAYLDSANDLELFSPDHTPGIYKAGDIYIPEKDTATAFRFIDSMLVYSPDATFYDRAIYISIKALDTLKALKYADKSYELDKHISDVIYRKLLMYYDINNRPFYYKVNF